MSLQILGTGTAVPAHKLPSATAIELAQKVCCTDDRQRRLVKALYRLSNVTERRTAIPHTEAYRWLPDGDQYDAASNQTQQSPTTEQRAAWYREHATPLAIDAARVALDQAQVPIEQITHLVTVSCTGFDAPGVDLGIIKSLKLRPTTERIHVGFMGCHGALNGIRVANALAHQPGATVLMVAVELCSLHYCFHWDSERMLGNALFADGAGAIVGTSSTLATLPTSRSADHWQVLATGSLVLPETTDLMSWQIGNHGFEMSISSQLPSVIEQQLGDWLRGWLAEQGVPAESINSWAVHPGGPKIIEAVESAMQLDATQTNNSREVLANHGNMSSATLLFILDRLRKQNATGPCVMIGFGPGIVTEVVLLG